MQIRVKDIDHLLSGSPEHFSLNNRSFNWISVITFTILIIFVFVNLAIDNAPAAFLVLGALVVQSILYYFSRFRKQYKIPIVIYAWTSYVLLIATFFVNSGMQGPVIFLFLLTFHLIIAFTSRKSHPIWISLHLATVVILALLSYYRPELIVRTYESELHYYIDMLGCYCTALLGIYAITMYLKNSFKRERVMAEKHAHEIEIQHFQLQTLNEQKAKMLSILAHDLRSPLNSIQSHLELLKSNLLQPEEKREMENLLFVQTRSTAELLQNLLSWSKSQLEQTEPDIQVLPVGKTLRGTLEMQALIAAEKDIAIRSEIEESLEISADPDMFQLVIRNLISNAIKFSFEGSEIIVRAKKVNAYGEISVQDFGEGIPLRKQFNLFSFKARPTFGTKNEKGVGLGLLLCQEYVLLQNGLIYFNSVPGKGTTMFVRLPLANYSS